MKFFPNQKSDKPNIAADLRTTSTAYLRKIISDTGRALAESQGALDQAWIQAHRARTRILEDGAFALPQPAAYSIPRASLEVNLEMRGSQSEEGETHIVATPVNAETSKKRSLDISLTSSLKMNFVLLPTEEAPPAETNDRESALDSDGVLKIAAADPKLDELIQEKRLVNPNLVARYRPESRKWSVEVLSGDNAVAVLLVDDATGDPLQVVDLEDGIREPDIKPLGPPRIDGVVPMLVTSGDMVLVQGDNLGGLDLSRTKVYLGQTEISPAELTVERLQFKIEDSMIGGLLRVVTPQGDSALIPSPTDSSGDGETSTDENDPAVFNIVVRAAAGKMEPSSGYFDPVTRTGSVVKITGGGITEDTELEFAGGAVVKPHRLENARTAYYRVPSGARSGPVALITRNGDARYSAELEGAVFLLRPYVRGVSPREARGGEYITITGNHLQEVDGLRIGSRDLNFTDREAADKGEGVHAIVSEQMIAVRVPDTAGDGSLQLRAGARLYDTRSIFYQVPDLRAIPDYGIRGEIIEITGTGLGEHRDSLTVRFQGEDGPIAVEVMYLDDPDPANPGLRTAGCRVPLDAVTGPIALIRAEIHSEDESERTAGHGDYKLLVFEAGTLPEDIISVRHFADGGDDG